MAFCRSITVLIAALSIIVPIIWKYQDRRDFNFRTTTNEAAIGVTFDGKIAIVTGANTGLGKPTAKLLLKKGATVIMGCRNIAKANKAKNDIIDEIIDEYKFIKCLHCFKTKSQLQNHIEPIKLDLASFKSIEQFTTKFSVKYQSLNFLILNAGISPTKWTPTENGIESTFGVNHVGNFYLTKLLTPLLIKSATTNNISRVISVASWAHNWAPSPLINWLNNDTIIQNKDLFRANTWDTATRYGFSKACNILFAREYNKRYQNKNVYAVSVHPGAIATGLARDNPWIVRIIWNNILGNIIYVFKTKEQGAATTIRAVSIIDDEFKKYGGAYFVDCNEANSDVRSDLFPDGVDKNEMPQQLLWRLTETMIQKHMSYLN